MKRSVVYETYGKPLEKFKTFRFHGHKTVYFIHDAAELQDLTVKLIRSKKRTALKVFFFFYLMCSKQPLYQHDVLTLDQLRALGDLQ